MNLNIRFSMEDLEEALLNTGDISHEEAFSLVKLMDEDVIQDWDFTTMLAKYFVLQMKQTKNDEDISEVWNEFESWLKEELK